MFLVQSLIGTQSKYQGEHDDDYLDENDDDDDGKEETQETLVWYKIEEEQVQQRKSSFPFVQPKHMHAWLDSGCLTLYVPVSLSLLYTYCWVLLYEILRQKGAFGLVFISLLSAYCIHNISLSVSFKKIEMENKQRRECFSSIVVQEIYPAAAVFYMCRSTDCVEK